MRALLATVMMNHLRQIPAVEFDSHNPGELNVGLSSIMPDFREWIDGKRKQGFNESLGRLVVGGLAGVGLIAVVSGVVAASSRSSREWVNFVFE